VFLWSGCVLLPNSGDRADFGVHHLQHRHGSHDPLRLLQQPRQPRRRVM